MVEDFNNFVTNKACLRSVRVWGDNPIFQERFEWFNVNNFLHILAQVAEGLELRPEDMVHIGGISLFYRCYEAFSSSAVMYFRGTRDMDIISFRQGSVKQLLDTVVNTPVYQVSYYEEFRDSQSLPDKKSVTLELEDDIKRKRKFGIDLYESASSKIRFNDRVLLENKVILDPPERLSFPRYKGLVSVPSLRDAFIIKMDIIDCSQTGLRPKDQLDVLTTLKIIQVTGKSFDELLVALTKTSELPSVLKKLSVLEELFLEPPKDLQLPEAYPFAPTPQEFAQAIKDVRRFRDYEIRKIISPLG